MDTLVKDQILSQLERLSPLQQQSVLQFMEVLTKARKNPQGYSAMTFTGVLSDEDAALMTKIIEEDCERIEPHEW